MRFIFWKNNQASISEQPEADAPQRLDRNAMTVADTEASLGLPRLNSFSESVKAFGTVFSYAFRTWPLVIALILLSLAGAALGPLSAFLFASVTDVFIEIVSPDRSIAVPDASGLSLDGIGHQLGQWGRDITNGQSLFVLVLVLTSLFALAAVLYQVIRFLARWVSWLIQITTFYHLQRDLYARLINQPLSFFHKERVGDLMSRAHNDVAAATGPLGEVLQSITVRLITLAAFLYLMFSTHVALTFIMLGLGAMTALAPNMLGWRVRRLQASAQTQIAVVTSVIQETLSSARLVKSFATESHELDRYWDRAMGHFEAQKRVMFLKLLLEHSGQIIIVITLATLLVAGGGFTSAGSISIAGFAAFLFVARESSVLLAGIATSVVQVYAVLGASDRILDLLHQESSMVDGDTPKATLNGRIELQDVSFDYGNGPVLKNINISINKGDFVAFVGPSGSGKSTLVDILLRLQDPTAGQVFMDGEDIRTFTLATYRRVFGTVSQETILFNDTVTNNIAYGASDASKEAIERAAKVAHADEFINRMPAQYDTFVGDRGARVSGGERQRLAIARALVSQPDVLVFDEATSSLDNRSERRVQQTIDELVGTRTAVVVAHRLSTIAHADRIYVLDQGQVVESGTHADLQKADGLYASLLGLQNGADVTFLEDPSEKGDNLHE